MSAYSYKIEYKLGSQNECADCLSTLPAPSTSKSSAEKTGMILNKDHSTLPVVADLTQVTCRDSLLAVVFQKVHVGQWTGLARADLMPYYRRWTELSLLVVRTACHYSQETTQTAVEGMT